MRKILLISAAALALSACGNQPQNEAVAAVTRQKPTPAAQPKPTKTPEATPEVSTQAQFVSDHEDDSKCQDADDFFAKMDEAGMSEVSEDGNQYTYTDGTHRVVADISPMEVCIVESN